MKIIFGLVGSMASGKGTVKEYLEEKYNASGYTFSTMLSYVLERFHLEKNRDNLIKLSEIMRESFGEDIMAKTMAYDVEKDANEIIVVEGIRRMADIEYLTKLPGFVLIEIFANSKLRYDRITKRSEKADDKTKSYEEFMEDHKRSTEISINEVVKHATEKIDNNGNIEDLQDQLDKLIEKYSTAS